MIIIKSLLLLLLGSLVICAGGKGKESEQAQSSLDVVDEVDVMVVLALLHGTLRLHALNSQRQDTVGHLIGFNFAIEFLVTVFALNVRNLVLRPHDGFPVRLVVLKEQLVVVGVLSKAYNDVLGFTGLRPLHTLEGEDLQSLRNVEDGSFFSSLVLKLDRAPGSVCVIRHHVDAALGKLHKEYAWMEVLVH